jgi:hypothetical protein
MDFYQVGHFVAQAIFKSILGTKGGKFNGRGGRSVLYITKIGFRKVTSFCSETSTLYTEKIKFSHNMFCKIAKISFSISYLSNGKFKLHKKFLSYVNEPQDCHPKS